MSASRPLRRKVLVLTSTFPRWPNDADPPFVYELCCRLAEEFQLHVLAPRAPGSRSEEEMSGMRVSRYRYFLRSRENLAYQGGILAKLRQKPARTALIPFFLLGQLSATMRLLRREDFDCIHAHWLLPQGLVAAAAARMVRRPPPLIVTAHGSDLFAVQGPAFDWMRRRGVRASAAVTVVSDAMKQTLRRSAPSGAEIAVIPMGVDLSSSFVPPESRSDNGLVVYVGRLLERKGVSVLIRAMSEVCRTTPSARLQLVGDGPDKDMFRQLAARLKLQDRVEFTGALEKSRLPAVYRSASVVVFPSLHAEGFGLVPVEAMGCGCAVVASDLPAVQEVIRDGDNGLLVPPGDSHRLARAAVKLLADPQLRQRLGDAGRRDVLKRFEWARVAGRYRQLIRTVMSNGALSRQTESSAKLTDERPS